MSYNNDRKRPREYGNDNFPPSKKAKTIPPPSKVLFLRNLPPDAVEEEVIEHTSQYGGRYVILLTKNRQAFLEFETIEQATTFINTTNGKFFIRNYPISMMYSDRPELIKDMPLPKQSEQPNFILLATVSDNKYDYPLTVDVFHQIFSRYGAIQKIVVFQNKVQLTQGLIQFAETGSAGSALDALDGQNIYNGCCRLKVQFSTMTSLNVKQNNDKTRDYTNPHLPSTASAPSQQPPAAPYAQQQQQPSAYAQNAPHAYPPANYAPQQQQPPHPYDDHTAFHQYAMQQQQQQQPSYHQQQSPYAAAPPPSYHHAAPPQHSHHPYDAHPQHHAPPPHHSYAPAPQHHHQPPPSYHANYYDNMPPSGGPPPSSHHHSSRHERSAPNPTPVLLINKLSTKAKCDDLFILFGVYGDVERVKVLPNKPDTALVQFEQPSAADSVLNILRKGVPLFGSTLVVARSKHATIEPPRKHGDEKETGFKSYKNSALARYKNSKESLPPLCAPTPILWVWHIAPQVAQEQLHALFSKHGQVLNIFMEEERDVTLDDGKVVKCKACKIVFETVEDAVNSLVELHDYPLEESRLKIFFTE